jgi:hypothetical protein
MAATDELHYVTAKSDIKRPLMLSDRAYMALNDLDNGLKVSCSYPVARELIAAGLAIDEWGYLALSEAGRRAARAKTTRQFIINDENVADLAYRRDPMENPATPPAPVEHIPAPIADTEPPAALEPPADDYARGWRAAGVATGVTKIEVDTRWVVEFVKAYVEMR